MQQFKKIDNNKFFILVDMPLYDTQCQKLASLMPDSVALVEHDHYGSFIITLVDGVEQTAAVYEEIWEAGIELFMAFNNLDSFGECGEEDMEIEEAWNYVVDLNEQCGYTYTVDGISETVGYAGFDKQEIDKIAVLHILSEAA